jgi:hypothetical protein
VTEELLPYSAEVEFANVLFARLLNGINVTIEILPSFYSACTDQQGMRARVEGRFTVLEAICTLLAHSADLSGRADGQDSIREASLAIARMRQQLLLLVKFKSLSIGEVDAACAELRYSYGIAIAHMQRFASILGIGSHAMQRYERRAPFFRAVLDRLRRNFDRDNAGNG